MILLLIPIVSISGIALGKILFKKWINHLTIYCFIWGGLVFLYELKLLPYVNLIPLTWFYIISAFLSFLFGITTVISGRNLYPKIFVISKKSNSAFKIFIDDGITLKYSIFFFSIACLFVAILNWWILIKMFGSIPAVFINSNLIYKLGNKGEIKTIPYISILGFGYIAVFFSGIYAAYKGRFSLLTFFPFLGIVIQELSTAGRAGILFAFMEFLFSFFLFRNLLKDTAYIRFKFSKRNAFFASAILLIFLIASTSFVRITRGSFENYVGTSRELKQLKDNYIITPSVYLYLSSDVGVLSQYLKSDGENTKFGQNSFLLFYDMLAKLGAVERPKDFQKGYYIPMWTNTGTYIRELHADFGVPGALLVPYFLGLLITWLWFKFYEEKSLVAFAFLVYLYLVVGFSFLVMITRLPYYFGSLIMILLYLPFLNKMAGNKYKKSPNKYIGKILEL